MVERRKGLSADERLAALKRDRARVRRERLQRELAGPRWRRMMQVIPAFFLREGEVTARLLRVDRQAVLDALRPDAVFAMDTAMRLALDRGFLVGDDVQVYLRDRAVLDRLAEAGLIDAASHPDTVVSRPWGGPARLLACVVTELPPWREIEGGYRVVSEDRLRSELIGEVGARADLFSLLENGRTGATAAPNAAE